MRPIAKYSVDPYQIHLGLRCSLSHVCPNILNFYVISINKFSMKVFAGRTCPKVNFIGHGWRYRTPPPIIFKPVLTGWRFVQRHFLKLHHRKVSTRFFFMAVGTDQGIYQGYQGIYNWKKNSFESSIKELWNSSVDQSKNHEGPT